MTSATTNEGRDMPSSFAQLLARYERIIEISQQLNSTFDQMSLLRKIITASMELTNSEAASILLLDGATGELRFELASNIKPTDFEKIVVPIEGSIAGWVVTHGEPRVIQDVSHEPAHYTKVDDTIQFRTRNMLAVPMRAHNKVIGTLEAVNKRDGEEFSEEDIKTLTALAGQAAIAIENTRLFQQSDFMSEMVHELRTPLAALKTSTVLLLRPDLPENRRQEMILTMRGETDRLISMTTDFLDLSRWESGRARLEPEPFDLPRLIAECMDIVEPQAADRSITMSNQVGAYTLTGDRGKIKQVLLNLLTNGIKYNRDGGTLDIKTLPPRVDHDPFVVIAVADNGYGISRDAQKNMFQKFYRVAETAGQASGTGLGLAITKHIVEAHNGEIWLESEKDVGSTFFISLPVVQP